MTPKWFTDEEESGMTRFEFGGECPTSSPLSRLAPYPAHSANAQPGGLLTVGRLYTSQRLDLPSLDFHLACRGCVLAARRCQPAMHALLSCSKFSSRQTPHLTAAVWCFLCRACGSHSQAAGGLAADAVPPAGLHAGPTPYLLLTIQPGAASTPQQSTG